MPTLMVTADVPGATVTVRRVQDLTPIGEPLSLDDQGRLILPLVGDVVQGGVLLVQVEKGESSLSALVDVADRAFTAQQTRTFQVAIDLASSVVARRLTSKVAEVARSMAAAKWPGGMHPIMAEVAALTETVRTTLAGDVADVRVNVARDAARTTPTAGHVEDLANAMIRYTLQGGQFAATVSDCNRQVVQNMRDGGPFVAPALWQFAEVVVRPPQVKAVEGAIQVTYDDLQARIPDANPWLAISQATLASTASTTNAQYASVNSTYLPAPATGGGGGGVAVTPVLKKIAFQANRDGNAEIYVMNSDGTNQTRLTTNAVTDSDPDWSPDGSKIAWISNGNVWVMNADGSHPVQLTNTAQTESTPRWSPDGTKLLYVSERDTPGFGEIYVMDAVDGNNDQEGDNRKRLTSNGVADYWPRWSPNGNRFAFVANTGTAPGVAEIYVGDPVDANNDNVGDNMIRLTNNNSDDLAPNWSPDSTKLVFRALRHGIAEIYRMDADGNNPLRLTSLGVNTDWPIYSPNGQRVAYLTFINPTNQIALMDPVDANTDGAGDNYLQLTTAGGDHPRFSSDGTQVLVESGGDLWVFPVTGGAGTRLTTAAGNDVQAAWQP